MHDISWRAHPDYRHEVCFDEVTRANLGGLTHKERVFLGVALLHRYKNSRDGSPFTELFEMLSDDDLRWAEILGKAMRFGAMFSAQRSDQMGRLKWHPGRKLLVLQIGPESKPLFSEVAQARFASLVKALDADSDVTELVQG